MGLEAGNYTVQLRCFSAPFFQKYDKDKINELNYGGKILLPSSSLDNLIRRHIQWPMLFKITPLNPECQRVTHAGVLEFLAEEGKCYLPSWMMDQLGLTEGELVSIENKSLPSATYAKFKPLSTDFLHISNPRAMLEVELRKFACLTKNDTFAVRYNDQVYEFKVMDVKPVNAVAIIECDVNIEFDAPEGYVEPTSNAASMEPATKTEISPALQSEQQKPSGWVPFSGQSVRLDGKDASKNTTISPASDTGKSLEPQPKTSSVSKELSEIVADENYQPGLLKFVRYNYKSRASEKQEKNQAEGSKPFTGKGRTIR